ncbi:hypothetical protein ClosIBUN125C_CONTIG57g03168 [Clostridium sp. IBUN125C]|nr:hypothetical protein ClosIBUN125C_CONTIG57g03168 [Clostridium sp. IBUN125C]
MYPRTSPVPFATHSTASSATVAETPVLNSISLSKPCSKAPPPVINIPLSIISDANSGGVLSNTFFTVSTIF